MTTIDLLQRYPPHKDSIRHDKASHQMKAFVSKEPDPTLPNPIPSQYFDAKTKLLHDTLDKVVKDLANSQSEPASNFRTLWRSPFRPRSRSPAYSEISDSFESPGRIEHCTNNLLSTPMSPTSAQFKGPDGWPLGIEVAMNDFHRGRLSTSILEEEELPNRLTVRKRQRETFSSGGICNREGQEHASCESISFERQCDGQNQHQGVGLEPLAFQKRQSKVLFQQYSERQDRVDSASLKLPASQQQSSSRPQQPSDCRHRQESVDSHLAELQEQSGGETYLDILCIPTLCARKYGDDQNSLGDASTDLHPAPANSNVPIGRGLENAGLEFSVDRSGGEEHDGSHTRMNCTCLLRNDSPQTALSDTLPHNKKTHGITHQSELRISALADALVQKPHSSRALGAFENIGVGSIDSEIDCQNRSEDSGNQFFFAVGSLQPEESKANTDSDGVPWESLGLLEDILEESEDLPATTSTLRQDRRQHFAPGSAESFDLHCSSGVGGRRDNMFAIQRHLAEPSTLLSSPSRAPPPLKLTINPSSILQLEATKPSRHSPIGAKSSESILSAATMAELKDSTRRKGCLSAAALAEMRKTAESQPHFQTGPDLPEDQYLARTYPLLRVKSFSRPFFQPNQNINDSALRYIFNDDEKEGPEVEEIDSVSPQGTSNPSPLSQSQNRDAESFVPHTPIRKNTPLQLGKMEDTAPRYLCKEDDTEGQQAEYAGTSTPQRSTLRSSNDTSLVPSLENVTPSSSLLTSTSPSTTNSLSASAVWSPDVMSSSIFQPAISSASTCYYPSSAITSPASYNSWASIQHHREHGNSHSAPSSAMTLINSTVLTPNTPFHNNANFSYETKMTPSSSFGQFTEKLPSPRGTPMTPSLSSGDLVGNQSSRRSVSLSGMFARYHKARYPDLPTAAMNDSMFCSKDSATRDPDREVPNDPFTSTQNITMPFSFNLKAPDREDLTDAPTMDFHKFNTPTKRSSGRFGVHRRSLSMSGRSNAREGIERALSTLVFNPLHSRPQKGSHNRSASIDTTAQPGSSRSELRRSFSIATSSVDQRWELAPPPTSLNLRDEFSVRYRPEPLEADDHYASRKDVFQGMKQGLKKVFGHL